MESLRTALREALIKLEEPGIRTGSQYLEALGQLRGIAGDAGYVRAIDREIRTYRDPGDRDFSAYPKLGQLREFYEKTMAKLDANHRRSQVAVLTIYRDRFRDLTESLERAGGTEEAVRAGRELKKVEAAIEDPDRTDRLLALWSMETVTDVLPDREITIDRRGGAFVVRSSAKAGRQIRSVQGFKLPFEVRLRIATDSTNIRIYIDRRLVTIFNWEVKPTELRVHDPTRGTNTKIPVRGKGYLEPGVMHDIRILVKAGEIRILADGELRYLFEGDFSTVEGDVGVGPAFGSTLTIERFDVFPFLQP